MRKSLFLALALAAAPLAVSLPAKAQNMPPDGKATVDDAKVVAALRKTVGHTHFTVADARVIGPLLYADNTLTRNESDLILELAAPKPHAITVTTKTGDKFVVPPPDANAQAFMQLSDPPDLNTLWLKGPKEMKKLVDVTLLNPNVIPQVEQFFGQNLYVSWRVSLAQHSNRYITDTLNAAMGQFQLAGPETARIGQKLLYEAMVSVDQANGDAIPDKLYAYLKPKTAQK